MYSARLTRQEETKDSKDTQGYLVCGFIVFAGSITKRASLYSIFINSRIGSLTNHLCKHMFYFQAGGKQLDFLFNSIFHLLVLTTVLGLWQPVPDFPAIRESMPPAGYPKNTCPACTQGTSRTNPSPSYPGCLGPRPNWDSKPPPLSPELSAVQGPPNPKITLTVGPERAGSMIREQQVFQATIPKYVLRITSLPVA